MKDRHADPRPSTVNSKFLNLEFSNSMLRNSQGSNLTVAELAVAAAAAPVLQWSVHIGIARFALEQQQQQKF